MGNTSCPKIQARPTKSDKIIQMAYKRVLLKLSGEMFTGKRDGGIDSNFVSKLAAELKDVVQSTKAEVVVVVGGGNIMRARSDDGQAIDRVTADYMGMLGTVLNGMALVDSVEKQGQAARLLSRIHVASVAEPYIRRRGIRHLEKGRLVVVAGGTGNPYVTTDTAAVTTALELGCEVVLKATKVDGVYDKDPQKDPAAKKFDKLSWAEAAANADITVMDNSAVTLAAENKLPIIVFDLLAKDNIKKVIQGETVGTTIG